LPDGRDEEHAAMDPLPVATFAFTASDDVGANAERLKQAVAEAGRAGAKVLLTPECGLVGYPGAARPDLAAVDWCRVGDEEDVLELAARRAGLVLVLGTAGPFRDTHTFSNDALVLNAGPVPLRYRKRALTPGDTAHFVPGEEHQPATVAVAGWTLGLSICYELRFGTIWAEQSRTGADAFLSIAHMAGPDVDPGTKAEVIPNLYSARAAEWATPLLLANTAAADRWVDSGHWDARGVKVANRAEGVLVSTLQPRASLAKWYTGLRDEALRRARG
jgi:predicted amidohydrolase